MRRDQKKTTKRTSPTKTKSTQKQSYGFDRGGRLDSKYKEYKKEEKAVSKKIINSLILFLTSILLIATIVGGIYVYLKVSDYDTTLIRKVTALDTNFCKEYAVDRFEGVLLLSLDASQKLKTAEFKIFIPTESKTYGFNFTNYEFLIDKAGTKGNLQRYVEINNVFLDKKSTFKYLSNLFYREFYLKVDKVVVQSDQGGLKEYSDLYTTDLYTKLNPQKSFEKNISIETDICRSSWNTFASEYAKRLKDSETVDFKKDKKISDLYSFNSVKKEQLRIQINNLTGLERAGNDFATTLTSYGLNVVKVDFNQITQKNTTIYIDRENLKSTQTLLILQYIIENQIKNPEIKIQSSIFSDVYIDMGEDMLAQ